jgi:VIT1/CCC1 family predicted Fe2+/Mn2+ transporter
MTSLDTFYIDSARNELTEHLVYGILARRERDPENRALLEKLSLQEKGHYEFWKSLVPGSDPKPYRFSLIGIPLLRTVFGVTFTTKLLETHEKGSIETYEAMVASLPPAYHDRLREVINDERMHEKSLLSEIKEMRIAYIGFIALGLADAIVEITGVHAGFLGVTGSTLITGISGVVVGFAAAISMGSAAYIQAKQDTEKSAIASGLTTWASYFFSVIFLALPYFLIKTMIVAFITSTVVGVLLLAAFTFFSAIVSDRKFWREIGESVVLMLATALATYLLGVVVGRLFHTGDQSF